MVKSAVFFAGVVIAGCGSSPSAGSGAAGSQNVSGGTGGMVPTQEMDAAGMLPSDRDAGLTPPPDVAAPVRDATVAREAGRCADPGVECTGAPASCCTGASCLGDKTFAICSANCAAAAECKSMCCIPLQAGGGVCGPASYCAPPDMTTHCPDLKVVGYDGTYLGDAKSDQFAANGVCNQFSQYGSTFAATSIYNTFGTYGSEFSSLSAYNKFATTPPALVCASTKTVVALVSKNTFLASAIDPDTLCKVLAANGY